MKALLHTMSTIFLRLLLQSGCAVVSTYLPAPEDQGRLITLPSTPVAEPAVGRGSLYVRPSAGRPRRLAGS